MTPSTTAKGGVLASASPYPWPYHANFDPAHCALVACADPAWLRHGSAGTASGDNGQDHPAGANAKGFAVAGANLASLSGALRSVGALVVWVTSLPARGKRLTPAQGPVPLGQRGSVGPGATSLAAAMGTADDIFVRSRGVSAFYESDLDGILHHGDITDLVIAGWGLEGPVHSTMRDANDRGYECLLVLDACSPIDPALVGATSSMTAHSGGVFGAVAMTQAFTGFVYGICGANHDNQTDN